MHGILHMEQNFKGEYSSQSYMPIFFGRKSWQCSNTEKYKMRYFSKQSIATC